jgi:hypothetical protein
VLGYSLWLSREWCGRAEECGAAGGESDSSSPSASVETLWTSERFCRWLGSRLSSSSQFRDNTTVSLVASRSHTTHTQHTHTNSVSIWG